MIRAAATGLIDRIGDTVADARRSYDTVTDENGKLIRDEDGNPMRDARDLPPATETVEHSASGRKADIPVRRGRESAAASQLPDTTYKVTHIDVDTDYDFDDEFGNYKAILRAISSASVERMHLDTYPSHLTDLEKVKRMERCLERALEDAPPIDATVERLSPIAFRITGIDDSDRTRISRYFNLICREYSSKMDYYGITKDGDDIILWTRHVYSYPEWRDEDEVYSADKS